METLNIFNSIYFFIAFIIAAAFMLTMTITSMCEVQKPRTNARFFVTKGKSYDNHFALWLGKPEWNKMLAVWYAGESNDAIVVCHGYSFDDYKLDLGDFLDMENGEIRQVFINMED